MISAFLVGITLGIAAKYLILGNYSSNFIVPSLIGVAGAFSAQFFALRTGTYRIDDPMGIFASMMGSFLFLMIYFGVVRRSRTDHRV